MSLSSIFEIVKIIVSLGGLLGIYFAIKQLRTSTNSLEVNLAHLKLTHDRAKRDRAILMLVDFSHKLDHRWRSATRLVESISPENVRNIHLGNRFVVKAHQVHLIEGVFPLLKLDLAEDYHLKLDQVHEIRTIVSGYINHIEFICHAAMSDIADAEVIALEFRGIYNPEKDMTFCKTYREVGPGTIAQPMIEAFISKILNNPKYQAEDLIKKYTSHIATNN